MKKALQTILILYALFIINEAHSLSPNNRREMRYDAMQYAEGNIMDENVNVDQVRYRAEKEDYYGILGEDDIMEVMTAQHWLETVLKWLLYGIVGSVCLIIGVCVGYFFVDFWRNFKCTVVHIPRF